MQEKIQVHNEQFAYEDGMPFHVIEIVLKPGTDLDLVDRLMHHWHSELEICLCLEKGSHHFIDGNEYLSAPGRLMIVNSGSIHHFELEPFTEKEPKRIAILLLVQKEYLRKRIPGADSLRFSEAGEADAETASLMEKLACYAVNDDGISTRNSAHIVMGSGEPRYSYLGDRLTDWQKMDLEGLVLRVLAGLVRDRSKADAENPGSRQTSASDCGKMKEILTYIEEHYQEPVSQEQVAKEFFYSTSYFSVLFRKNMQTTFSRYLSDYRARKARFDLLETDESIYSIAVRNGFADSRRFILAFRERYGMTPLQYRKSNVSKNSEPVQNTKKVR